MRSYDQIFQIAADRKGGADALEELLNATPANPELASLPDSHWLEEMTRSIFQSGFSWKVIEQKWDGFREAFRGFDVGACAFMDDDWFDDLTRDTRIVRNAPKIATVRDNAVFLYDLAREHGTAAKVFADWPVTDQIGLMDLMKTRGSRLGGTTGQRLLRYGGKDSFVLSQDVVARLVAEGVVDKNPTSKAAMRAVQAAFNDWHAESGRPMTQISRTLAYSV